MYKVSQIKINLDLFLIILIKLLIMLILKHKFAMLILLTISWPVDSIKVERKEEEFLDLAEKTEGFIKTEYKNNSQDMGKRNAFSPIHKTNFKDGNPKTYTITIFQRTLEIKQLIFFLEGHSWEAYLKVSSGDSEGQLHHQEKVFTSKTNDFSFNVDYNSKFLLNSALPSKLEKVNASYSGNFCNQLLGIFLPVEDITLEYYPRSGVYHFQKFEYPLKQPKELLQVVENQDQQGSEIFSNPFVQEIEKGVSFAMFCPFRIQSIESTFSASLDYKFEFFIDRNKFFLK
jgi:hypothetical protein